MSDKGVASEIIAGQNFVIAKMTEVFPTIPTLGDDHSTLQEIKEAKQNAKIAKQVFNMITHDSLKDLGRVMTEHSKVTPDFKQNGLQSSSLPVLRISTSSANAKQ